MDGYFGPNDIMKKLQYAVKESNVDLYWGEVIELLGEALEALEAKDGQIAKLESDKVHLLGALEREEQIHAERTDELEAKILRIAELMEALEFYGNHMTYVYRSGMDAPIRRDNHGDRARKVLKKK